jgi:glycosyltransferase involved in cell wall biosynthesis
VRVCFVLPDLSASGGIAVALRHADQLRDHGLEVDTIVLDRDGEQPAARSYDVAVATWWTTLPTVWRLNAKRRAVFVQGPDDWFYRQNDAMHRFSAGLATLMPADVIAVSSWLAELVRVARPDARCHVVPNGVDKTVFSGARAPRSGPLRVLVEGSPSLWFKGVNDAVAAVRSMQAPAEVTLVGLEVSDPGELGVDRALGGLEQAEVARLYGEHDVLVKLSRFEGLGLPPLEGFHLGLPCIVTPYGGHAEYVEHGRNGLVVGFDDLPATTRWLDILAADEELLASLSRGARDTAAAWPDTAQSSAQLADALRTVAEAPAPSPEASLAAIAERATTDAELGYAELQHLVGSLEWNARALELEREKIDELHELVDELFRSRDDCSDMLEEARRNIEIIKESRAYRFGVALRRLKPGS